CACGCFLLSIFSLSCSTGCLSGVLVKGGDDLRQELLASQLVRQFKAIFDEARLPLWLRPYEILVTGSNSGMQVVGIRCMCEAGVGTLSQALFKV
ncbi:putative phosphatidylinositol 4-kinase, partial [Toxoplasma gondii ARI]